MYLVKVWTYTYTRPAITKYYEFDNLEEAKKFADERAKQGRIKGYEFDIMIYEATNY